MKSVLLFFLIFTSCASADSDVDKTSDISSAKGFIRSLFEGKFDTAEKYMVPNEENTACLKKYRFQYNQMINKEIKQQYKAASIVLEKEMVNDSICIIKYKDPVAHTSPAPLKIMKKNTEWVVDFAYSCSGNL